MKLSDYYIPTTGDVGYGDKGTVHSYLDTYDKLLEKYVNSNNNILEIGVCRGHSVSMLGKYFQFANIIGIDNMPELFDSIDNPNNNIQLVTGDATKQEAIKDFNNLDIVIDDGSHRLEDQITSFKLLWNKVNKNGIYIVEDIADLEQFKEAIENDSFFDVINKKFIDLRSIKNRYDDVLFVCYKG